MEAEGDDICRTVAGATEKAGKHIFCRTVTQQTVAGMEKYPVRRLAAHYLFFNGIYRMHYLEFDADNGLLGIFPLRVEVARTEFYNGIVWVVPEKNGPEYIEGRLNAWRASHPGKSLKECLEAETALPVCVPGMPAAVRCGSSGQQPVPEEPVALYWQRNIGFPPAEFGTYDRGGDGYVQRLGGGVSFRIGRNV